MARNFKTSGNIALKGDMATFFGDSGESSLTEYYRGGNLVPNNILNAGVPTGGSISITDLRGATNEDYILSVNPQAVNEGAVVTITLSTKNVPQNDPVYFTVSGIQSEDVVGNPSLSGNFTVGTTAWNGLTGYSTHAVAFTMKADLISDGGTDSDGYPVTNHETGKCVIYTDSGRGTEMEGDAGELTWLINDTSLSWYVRVTSPTTKENGVFTAAGEEFGDTMQGYGGVATVTAVTPSFSIDGYNAPTNFTITNMTPDTSYGNSGRIVTAHSSYPMTTQTMINQNVNAGYGNTLSNSSWANSTDTPGFTISRVANFGSGAGEGSYGLIIKERFKFDLAEVGGTSSTISSFYCIMKTTHVLTVQALGG